MSAPGGGGVHLRAAFSRDPEFDSLCEVHKIDVNNVIKSTSDYEIYFDQPPFIEVEEDKLAELNEKFGIKLFV